jgi:hypothetical protein
MREWRSVFRRFKEPPEMWPVQIGEIIHNLRSALDQLVYEASSLDENGNPRRGTEFPIFDDYPAEPSEERRWRRKVEGLNDATNGLVVQCQPFSYTGTAEFHKLSMLQSMSNTDKHRLLNFAATYDLNGDIIWNMPGGDLPRNEIEAMEIRPLDFDVEVLYLRTRSALPSDTQLEPKANISFEVLFDESTPGALRAVIPLITQIGQLVGQIRGAFIHSNPA